MYLLIPHYIFWHYTLGVKDYLRVCLRMLRAVSMLFSMRLMLKTFFHPFERLGERYHGGGVPAFFEIFVVNSLMRMVGMTVRACVIAIGSVSWVCAVIFSVCGLIIWIALPGIVLVLVYAALVNLIKAI